jgi:hypothetical protein
MGTRRQGEELRKHIDCEVRGRRRRGEQPCGRPPNPSGPPPHPDVPMTAGLLEELYLARREALAAGREFGG